MKVSAQHAAWAGWLCALWLSWAHGAPPEARWLTIETPNFRVHYYDGPRLHPLAQRVARACEEAHRRLVPLMGWAPTRKTEVLLTDDADSANGSATSFQRPVITVLADSPDDLSVLNDYDDYVWSLVVHEYAHVLHLDNASGLPEVGNRIFGRIFTPNAILPRWLVEGLATYQESNLSSAGRNRSSMTDMWIRSAVLEGQPISIDALSNPTLRWPRGHLAYVYGGRFVRYIAERVGEERLARYFAHYGGRVVPFALNATALKELGLDFDQLYRDWQGAVEAQYRTQLAAVAAAGPSRVQVLTSAGDSTGQAIPSPDGHRLYYLEASPHRLPAIRSMRLDGSDNRLHLELPAGGQLALAPNGTTAVFSAPQVFKEFNVFDDLYEADLVSGRTTRLTYGLRATEPAYAPHGGMVAFVGKGGAGTTYLGLLDLRTNQVHRLDEFSLDERPFTPQFTPDGEALIFSQKQEGGRAIRRLTLRGRHLRTLVNDPAMNLHPHPLSDGSVLFSSDRTGIFNVYRWWPDERLEQLTNVQTGAFHPRITRDHKQLVFSLYSNRGWDIARLAWDQRFRDQLPARPPRPAPLRQDDPRLVFPVRPYSPWASLLPQYWLPVAATDFRGSTLGVATTGADLTGRHRYALGVGWGLSSQEPSFSAGYSARIAYPTIDLGTGSAVTQASGFPAGVADRVWVASATLGFPVSRIDQSSSITLGYEWRAFVPDGVPSLQPDASQPLLPKRGVLGTLSLGWSINNVRRFAESISPELGHAASFLIRRSGPETLGTFEFLSAEARYQTYVPMPWASQHVTALRLSAGASVGDVGHRQVFSLGGISVQDPILQLLQGQRVGAGILRGYPPAVLNGSSFVLASLEYRFPFQSLERGLSTLPFYLRRIHGAVFADAGSTGDAQLQLGRPRSSVGAELRLELFLGYYLGAELRLGYARGLDVGGIHNPYFTVGSGF